MALQPAAGARDLNPHQVETNRNITERLARVFRLWGYDEVSPPRVERMKTLMAGGAIASRDIVRLVADDPLGLRPEMTASIARAACTRLATRPRPMGRGRVASRVQAARAIDAVISGRNPNGSSATRRTMSRLAMAPPAIKVFIRSTRGGETSS